ncbi:uncharacterized protein PAC_12982 [Phialocephala subalpina]|uniref:Uncharacterized protein n=1 Tax=Phialocephala subalpina TaxID=576137 RepID=A0A1L7XDH4_9HELO|nr:uncharacterized protein PAC_12982 [Phialocephala subalpina]
MSSNKRPSSSKPSSSKPSSSKPSTTRASLTKPSSSRVSSAKPSSTKPSSTKPSSSSSEPSEIAKIKAEVAKLSEAVSKMVATLKKQVDEKKDAAKKYEEWDTKSRADGKKEQIKTMKTERAALDTISRKGRKTSKKHLEMAKKLEEKEKEALNKMKFSAKTTKEVEAERTKLSEYVGLKINRKMLEWYIQERLCPRQEYLKNEHAKRKYYQELLEGKSLTAKKTETKKKTTK